MTDPTKPTVTVQATANAVAQLEIAANQLVDTSSEFGLRKIQTRINLAMANIALADVAGRLTGQGT